MSFEGEPDPKRQRILGSSSQAPAGHHSHPPGGTSLFAEEPLPELETKSSSPPPAQPLPLPAPLPLPPTFSMSSAHRASNLIQVNQHFDSAPQSAIDLTIAGPQNPLSSSPANHMDVIDLSRETVDLTEPILEDFGCIVGSCIGLDYFNVPLEKGDVLKAVRLQSQHDPKAIRLDDYFSRSVGFLDKSTAAALSPLMDNKVVHKVEAKVSQSPLPADASVSLRVYMSGFKNCQERMKKFMQRIHTEGFDQYVPPYNRSRPSNGRGEPGMAGHMAYGGGGNSLPVEGGKSLREIESDLDALFNNTVDMNKLKPVKAHRSILTPLYPYQQLGLGWMIYREKKRSLLAESNSAEEWEVIKRDHGKKQYRSKLNDRVLNYEPYHARGGIIADEMGLGKTLQIISLIASTSLRARWGAQGSDDEDSEDDDKDEEGPALAKARPTLIVSPLSVLSNWEKQFGDHVRLGHLDVHLYYGPNRSQDVSFISKKDVVLTTYNTLSKEYDDPDAEEREKKKAIKKLKKEAKKEARKPNPSSSKPVVLLDDDSNDDSDDEFDQDGINKAVSLDEDGKKIRLTLPTAKKAAKPKKIDAISRKKSSPMFKIRWQRIVLDEAHIIGDRRTLQSKACRALFAQRRWAITGTPFQNKIDDVYPLLNFLRVEPFTSYQAWNKAIHKPLKSGDKRGLDRLKLVLSTILLRRTKTQKLRGQPILHLPFKEQRVVKVVLQGQQKILYEKLAASGKTEFKHLLMSGSNYAFILEMLLRMRQACAHVNMVPPRYAESGFLQMRLSKDRKSQLRVLLNLLNENLSDPCTLCNKVPESPCVTICSHFFCKECLDRRLGRGGEGTCPMCSEPLTKEQIFDEEHQQFLKEDEEKARVMAENRKKYAQKGKRSDIGQSAKLNELLRQIRLFQAADPTFKAVVFSQWTSFLDIIQDSLKAESIGMVRLDGKMTAAHRKKALDTFQNDPYAKIFLISLKAGGVGLNLTSANKVFLMDPWWNPSVEDQAVDRVHRLGQKKDVEVIRFVCDGTMEENVVELQQRKRMMVKLTLSGNQKSQAQQKEEKLQDYKLLFK